MGSTSKQVSSAWRHSRRAGSSPRKGGMRPRVPWTSPCGGAALVGVFVTFSAGCAESTPAEPVDTSRPREPSLRDASAPDASPSPNSDLAERAADALQTAMFAYCACSWEEDEQASCPRFPRQCLVESLRANDGLPECVLEASNGISECLAESECNVSACRASVLLDDDVLELVDDLCGSSIPVVTSCDLEP